MPRGDNRRPREKSRRNIEEGDRNVDKTKSGFKITSHITMRGNILLYEGIPNGGERERVEGDRKGRLSVFRCLSAISRKQKGSGSFGLKTERDFSAERAISAEIGS